MVCPTWATSPRRSVVVIGKPRLHDRNGTWCGSGVLLHVRPWAFNWLGRSWTSPKPTHLIFTSGLFHQRRFVMHHCVGTVRTGPIYTLRRVIPINLVTSSHPLQRIVIHTRRNVVCGTVGPTCGGGSTPPTPSMEARTAANCLSSKTRVVCLVK